ncbi:hypothetical protein [Streptomyces sp. NPDC004291]
MAVPLTEVTVKRLAYIRMLYEQGVTQAKQPMPMGASSLLSLHDSVEMFLVLTSDALSPQVDRNTHFMDYWKKIKGVSLSGAHGMRRLNDARNGLKHAGAMPPVEVVEQALADTFAFFDDNVPQVFGAALWSVDTSYTIPQAAVREWTRKAAERFEAGEGGTALAMLQLALREVLAADPGAPYGTALSKLSRWRPAMEGLPRSFGSLFGRSFNTDVSDATRGVRELVEVVEGLTEAVRWMALGGNLHHYARFQTLTPSTIVWVGNPSEEDVDRLASGLESPTREEFDFCRQFVVTTALRQADIAAHVVRPSWRTKGSSPSNDGA